MTRLHRIAAVLLVAGLGACDSASGGSMTQPKSPRLDTSGDPVLSVTMSGTSYFTTPGEYTVEASVSGGSGTYRYHWYSRACWLYFDQVQCNHDYIQGEEGVGVNTYTRYYNAYDVKRDIYVLVQDVGSGSSTPATWKGEWYIENPHLTEPRPTGEYGFNCGKGLNWYPLSRYEQQPSGQMGWTEYYRSPCTGARVNKPL